MSIPRSVAEVMREHVTLEVECIDRMYLNVYQPRLQSDRGVAAFFRFHRGHLFASSALMDPISKRFIADVERFAGRHRVPLITFRKRDDKEEVVLEYRKTFPRKEGVILVGKAQEKTPVFRTGNKRGRNWPDENFSDSAGWLVQILFRKATAEHCRFSPMTSCIRFQRLEPCRNKTRTNALWTFHSGYSSRFHFKRSPRRGINSRSFGESQAGSSETTVG